MRSLQSACASIVLSLGGGICAPFPSFFLFNDTATTEIYTLSLHDALPIFGLTVIPSRVETSAPRGVTAATSSSARSEEHTSELQSHLNLVCRLLLEKKNRPPLVTSCQTPRTPRLLPSAMPPRLPDCSRYEA